MEVKIKKENIIIKTKRRKFKKNINIANKS